MATRAPVRRIFFLNIIAESIYSRVGIIGSSLIYLHVLPANSCG